MRRWVATCAAVLLVSAVLRADVTMTQTITVEGGAAAMMGGKAAPTITMRIKGQKARVETAVMGQATVMLTDLATRQMIMLNAADKTARVVDAASPIIPAGTAMPDMNVSFEPTGQKRTIENLSCDEYSIGMTMNMASMAAANPQMPPEVAQMLQDMKMVMSGSAWIARQGPGVAEFTAFQKASAAANMTAAISGAMGGGSNNGLDKVMAASASAQGMPYLTEMTMNVEGTGQIVDMLKQMGAMKITNKVTSISTEALADDLFKVPAGYTIVR
jgi:hypothetical protein